MALSIRNTKNEKLARKLAAVTGDDYSGDHPRLEERLERVRGRSTSVDVAEELLKISQRCSELPDRDRRSADEILGYDSAGVPQ